MMKETLKRFESFNYCNTKTLGNFEKINGILLTLVLCEFSTKVFWNIRRLKNNDIQIFKLKIFEYSYLFHFSIKNIFVFVFGPECKPEYIRIRIHIPKSTPNIFVLVIGPKENIRYALNITHFWRHNTVCYVAGYLIRYLTTKHALTSVQLKQ